MTNIKNGFGSSETTREKQLESCEKPIDFDFSAYLQEGTPQHRPFIKTDFLEWFIGFVEAEGCFQTWKNTNGSYRFGFEINQKDPGLMYKIRTRLGFGRVQKYVRGNSVYFRFTTSKKEHLDRLILLFNGNLLLEKKQKQFNNWLFLMNLRYKTNILVKPNLCKVSLSTAWLSGFLEGDAGFYVQKLSEKTERLNMKWYITQEEELIVLNDIRNLFQMPGTIYTLTNGHSTKLYNRLETTSLEIHLFLLDYLQVYPFLGKRSIQLSRWRRLVNYRKTKYKLTPKLRKKFNRLIDGTKPDSL
jgi:hypothetical protein